ncbi:hypothetical protein GDO78_002926 [Eleutherodactylus coqui]|uniref:Uncharacterized protein n=1 Tax=Eleutherodactylus coqui TaxID=57060 RepID=A0A8J6EWC0_ELECQ|nr:hypothetical protein GDO78_002926 [Eleutherodactylus coqui]
MVIVVVGSSYILINSAPVSLLVFRYKRAPLSYIMKADNWLSLKVIFERKVSSTKCREDDGSGCRPTVYHTGPCAPSTTNQRSSTWTGMM